MRFIARRFFSNNPFFHKIRKQDYFGEFISSVLLKIAFRKARTSVFFPTLIFLFLLSANAFSQFAALKKISSSGIRISHLPGSYHSPVQVKFCLPAKTGIEVLDREFRRWSDSAEVFIEETGMLKLRISSEGRTNDTIYAGLYLIREPVPQLPVISFLLDMEKFNGLNGILDGYLTSSGDRRGRVWKKNSLPVFLEYYEDGKFLLGENFRVKPFGGLTLGMKEKSLRIVTDEKNGPDKIRISPFRNKRFNSYKSLVLRTSGSDQHNTRLKDITNCSLAKDLGLDYQDFRQAVLYVNGEYWGIYNIREKINLEYLKYNHGAVKNEDSTSLLELKGLKNREYRSMVEYLCRDFPESTVIDSVNTVIDLENYINYIILQIHIQNIDSRGNVRFWKSKSLDNRWRWIFYDSDLGCSNTMVSTNYLAQRLSLEQTDWYNPTWSTVMLRKLTGNKPIRDYFINKYCLILAQELHQDTILRRIDFFAGNIRAEIPFHVKRRGSIYGETPEKWEAEVKLLKRYFTKRIPYAFKHIRDAFELSENPVEIEIKSNIPEARMLRLQHSSSLWNRVKGYFFPEVAMVIEATNLNHLYSFEKWSDGNRDKIRSIVPEENYFLSAEYLHKANSVLRGSLKMVHFGFRQSKKDSFFLLGIRNVSGKTIAKQTLTLASNGTKEKLQLEIRSLKPGEKVYYTNKPKYAKKNTAIEKAEDTPMLPGFDTRGGEWVLADASGSIIDTAFLSAPDTALGMKKMLQYYRDYSSGKWLLNEIPPEPEIKQETLIKVVSGFKHIRIIAITALVVLVLLILLLMFRKYLFVWLLFVVFALPAMAQKKDRFGLDSVHTKIIDNKGRGEPSLGALRNVRVVLKNLLYRGGNNNPLSVQNPLTDATLDSLHRQRFNKVIYLYSKNFTKFFPEEKLDSIRRTGLSYVCVPSLNSGSIQPFLQLVKKRADSRSDSLMYIHCWNGWHQSGWLSALTLMQFCGFSNQLALQYWARNTDNNFRGYHHVKEGILSFVPYPGLTFTEKQKNDHCPCIDQSYLDASYTPEVIMGSRSGTKKPEKTEKKKKSETPSTGTKAQLYVVKKGDTLSSIAAKHGLSIEQICRMSGIRINQLLHIGQQLRLR